MQVKSGRLFGSRMDYNTVQSPLLSHKLRFQKRGPKYKITKKRTPFEKNKAIKGSVEPKNRASAFVEKEAFAKYI